MFPVENRLLHSGISRIPILRYHQDYRASDNHLHLTSLRTLICLALEYQLLANSSRHSVLLTLLTWIDSAVFPVNNSLMHPSISRIPILRYHLDYRAWNKDLHLTSLNSKMWIIKKGTLLKRMHLERSRPYNFFDICKK